MDAPYRFGLAISTPFALYDSPVGGKKLPNVSVEWHRSRLRLQMPCGYNVGEIEADGYETGDARNRVVREAIAKRMKYLFFLDWDILLPPMALCRLIYLAENNPAFDIFSGVYCIKREPPEVMIWKDFDGSGVHWDWTFGDVLTDCVGVGTGCMLIRMSLFDRLDGDKEPWFKTSHEIRNADTNQPMTVHVTDDLWFCRRAVEEANAKLMIDGGILCGHINAETGVVYTLQDDSLPMKRYGAKQFIEQESQRWFRSGELESLERIAADAASRTERPVAVEIGSLSGTSAKRLSRGLNGHGVLHCIDTWEGTKSEPSMVDFIRSIGGPDAMQSFFNTNLRDEIGRGAVVPVRTNSLDAASRFAADGKQADLVFIDGDHETCEQDIAAWYPLVKDGGVICGHDYSRQFPSVVRDVRQAFGDDIELSGTLWIKRKEATNAVPS